MRGSVPTIESHRLKDVRHWQELAFLVHMAASAILLKYSDCVSAVSLKSFMVIVYSHGHSIQ